MTDHTCRGSTCDDPSHRDVTARLDPSRLRDVTTALDAYRATRDANTDAPSPSLFD